MKRLDARYKWGLTGQPVENRAEEVFSLMQWIDPSVLGPADVFDRTFIIRDPWGNVRKYQNLPVLHKALSRSMFRATRSMPGIAEQMPQVVEESVIVPFSSVAASLYRHVAAATLDALAEVTRGHSFDIDSHYGGNTEIDAKLGQVMSRLMCLRMLCDHPDLIRRSARLHVEGKTGGSGIRAGSAYAAELVEAGLLEPVTRSQKVAATLELVEEILDADPSNKIVLFSFFKASLAILKEATAKLTKSVLFTGDLTNTARQAAKVSFQTDPEVRLFLSSDAGGYGVDLPQANYLISLDLPWSAGAWEQRNSRIIRLSSEFRNVTLISMLMKGSIEERQYAALQQKKSIANAIVDGKGHDSKGSLSLDLDALGDFLAQSSV